MSLSTDLDWLPGLRQLKGYGRRHIGGDLVAGLLVAALAVPQALGYATVAGVPVQVGLYTLPPALAAYAMFGSSRVLFVGPVSTVSVLSGSIVRQISGGDSQQAVALTSALALIAGLVLLLAGLIRIGWVAQFLSEPIVTGFVAGLVALIVVGEIPGLLGLPTPSGSLPARLWSLAQDVDRGSPVTLLVSVAALLVLFGGGRLLPRVPWSLLVLAGGIVASQVLDLAGRGALVVGDVPTGLPVPHPPAVDASAIPDLITGGVAIAGVGIAEGLAAARTFSGTSKHERLQDDTELIANGVADAAAGMFGGMGVAGSLSKTAANARAGARTQMSSVVAAAAVVLVLLFATGLLAPLPRAVLSAIVIHAVWGLVHPRLFRRYLEIRRNDGIASLVALVGVLALGPLNGLLVAVGQSLLGLIYRSIQVHVDEMGKISGEKAAWGAVTHVPGRRRVPGVVVVRPDGPMLYPNAAAVVQKILTEVESRPDAQAVVLDLEATNQLDTTTVERIGELIQTMRSQNIDVYLVRVFGNVRAVMERAAILTLLGDGHIWHSIAAGVKAARESGRFDAARARVDAAKLFSETVPDSEDVAGEPVEPERIAPRLTSRDVIHLFQPWSRRDSSRTSPMSNE